MDFFIEQISNINNQIGFYQGILRDIPEFCSNQPVDYAHELATNMSYDTQNAIDKLMIERTKYLNIIKFIERKPDCKVYDIIKKMLEN